MFCPWYVLNVFNAGYVFTVTVLDMDTEHSNTLVSDFLKRLSYSTLAHFPKADLVDLATHSGWSKTEKVPKKAEFRG